MPREVTGDFSEAESRFRAARYARGLAASVRPAAKSKRGRAAPLPEARRVEVSALNPRVMATVAAARVEKERRAKEAASRRKLAWIRMRHRLHKAGSA